MGPKMGQRQRIQTIPPRTGLAVSAGTQAGSQPVLSSASAVSGEQAPDEDCSERKVEIGGDSFDIRGQHALLKRVFEPETEVAPSAAARGDGSRVWFWRGVKLAVGLAIAVSMGVVPLLRIFELASNEAIVNAPFATIRAPIDGRVAFEAVRTIGAPVEYGQRCAARCKSSCGSQPTEPAGGNIRSIGPRDPGALRKNCASARTANGDQQSDEIVPGRTHP